MCLSRITVKKTLKKDMAFWKATEEKEDGGIYSDDRYYLLSQGVHKDTKKGYIETDDKITYKLGFHCFLLKKDAIEWSSQNNALKVIIPAGTIVQYGRQRIGTGGCQRAQVIVTPVMIVP